MSSPAKFLCPPMQRGGGGVIGASPKPILRLILAMEGKGPTKKGEKELPGPRMSTDFLSVEPTIFGTLSMNSEISWFYRRCQKLQLLVNSVPSPDTIILQLFLLGPDIYGKGDWRSISRNFVISRTLTQVARHAQKYFIWLNSMNKDRRRASIHDITNVGNNGDISAPHGPITGQANEPMTVAGGKPSLQFLPGTPGIGAFGTTIGQPVGPLVSAIGTQFSIPVTPGQHMAFGVRAPVVGTGCWYLAP